MTLVNGSNVFNITNDYWQQEYLTWIETLSTLTLLKWVRSNYNIKSDENTSIEYWFIGEEKFCEIYYYNEYNEIGTMVIIVENVEKFDHSYSEIDTTIIIDKKTIIRELKIDKILKQI